MPRPRSRTATITLPPKTDEDLKAYVLRDECPACGSHHHLPSPQTAERGYHDEDLYIIANEARTAWLTYEQYTCTNCECIFRVILAPASIHITADPTTKEGLRGYDI